MGLAGDNILASPAALPPAHLSRFHDVHVTRVMERVRHATSPVGMEWHGCACHCFVDCRYYRCYRAVNPNQHVQASRDANILLLGIFPECDK
jgi:hypothetical protein